MKSNFGSVVLDAAARLIVPFILLFALYVLFHGHDSPGGGFQGGTILAAGVILLKLVRGDEPGWKVSLSSAVFLGCLGLAVYAGIGLAAAVFGGAYLDYGALPLPFPEAKVRALATLAVETGIAVAVMGVMLLIFDVLTAEEM